jgi:threonine/homoserine/homoserine lactone efflux protein
MLNLIALGLVMGFSFAAPPGVVAAETLRRGLARGFHAALGVQLGSLIGDATYALLALAGLAVLVQQPTAQRVLGVLGAGYLLYIAASSLRQHLVPSTSATALAQGESRRGAFRTGVVLSLTNPWAIGYWLALGGALASSGVTTSQGDAAVFFASFFSVCVAYAFVMAILAGYAQRALSATHARVISLACSLVIGALGVGFGLHVLSLWIGG